MQRSEHHIRALHLEAVREQAGLSLWELLPTNLLYMGSWESEVMACFWKGNFISPFLLTAERRECKKSYRLRKRTLHPLLSNRWLDRNIQFGRYPMQSENGLFKYLVSLWWSELWRGSELGQTQSFIAKGEQHRIQRVEASSWERSVSTETQCATGKFCVSQHCPEFGKIISHLPCFNILHFLVDWRSSPAGFPSTTAGIFSLCQLTVVITMAANQGCRS